MSRDNANNQDMNHYFMDIFSYRENMRRYFFISVYCQGKNSKTKIQIDGNTDHYKMTFGNLWVLKGKMEIKYLCIYILHNKIKFLAKGFFSHGKNEIYETNQYVKLDVLLYSYKTI